MRFSELSAAQIEQLRWYSAAHPKSLCLCGHSGDGGNSDHGGMIGHGPCTCGCPKFTWAAWLETFMAYRRSLDVTPDAVRNES